MNYGLIGKKLTHSFSKEIHEKITNYQYELKEIPQDELDSFMEKKDFFGINVTIPYKELVIPHLDEIDEFSASIGAVNTVVNKNGTLYGYNTDFLALKKMLEKFLIDPKGKKALILGTGGTCKTAKAVLENMGAKEILIVSRSENDGVITYGCAQSEHLDSQIIINTTPCGMYPETDCAPIDIDKFPHLSGVADAIYNPLRSSMVEKAIEKGINATGGLYMLVAQAVFAAGIFTGENFENLIDKIYQITLSEKENIVLVGMPGCGKSTVGRLLMEKMNLSMADTDELIVKKANMTIAEIFEKFGEAHFRDIESEVIKEISDKTGYIISTGGGAILRKENIFNLKKNGKIFFIDRPLENLIPTDDRPLSRDVDAIKKRYEERYGIYTSCADEIIDAKGDAKSIAEAIKRSIGQ